MLRARLAALALSGGLALVSGCKSDGHGDGGSGCFGGLCGGSGGSSLFGHGGSSGGCRLFGHGSTTPSGYSRISGNDCDCESNIIGAPVTMPTTVGPEVIVTPPPLPPSTFPGSAAPPPRVVPIPQAPTIPYTP